MPLHEDEFEPNEFELENEFDADKFWSDFTYDWDGDDPEWDDDSSREMWDE